MIFFKIIKNKFHKKYFYFYLIFSLVLLYLFFSIFLILNKVTSDDKISIIPCFTEQCLNTFTHLFPNFLALTSWFFTSMMIIITAIALRVSWKNFDESKRNSSFNNHINNIKFFTEHIERQLKHRSSIDDKSVDIHKFYNLIFPRSIEGIFSHSIEYDSATKSFRAYLIKVSNNTNKKNQFDDRKHQTSVIKHVEKLGIIMINLHKKDFYKIEDDILFLIDSITKTFTSLGSKNHLTTIDRHYR